MQLNTILKVIKLFELDKKNISIILNDIPINIKINIDIINKIFLKFKNVKKVSITNGISNNVTINNTITIIIEYNDDYYVKNNLINPYLNYLSYIKKYNILPYESMLLTNQITAYTIGGLILKYILESKFNIKFITHLSSINNISDKPFSEIDIKKLALNESDHLIIFDNRVKLLMEKAIKKAKNHSISLNGSLETIVLNIPEYLGDYTYSLKSLTSFILYMIPSLYSIEYDNGSLLDSEKNFFPLKEIKFHDDKLISNNCNIIDNNIGIITNKKAIIKCFFIPDSIQKEIETINYQTLENVKILKENINPISFIEYTHSIEAFISISLFELINKEG